MEILIIVILILLNGVFAMSEMALVSARKSNLEMQARQGSKGARKALKLAKDPDRFLSTVQIGITLIGILTGIYSGDTLAARFGTSLATLGIPVRTATVIAQVAIVIVVTYLTIIFGELVPKRIGMNAVLNSGAIKWNGKYLLVARVEGADRKSFFAVAESPNGVDNFRFWDYPVTMPDDVIPDHTL